MRLLAIDGNSIVNRAFFGVRLLTNQKGQYTNAIFGFLNILLKLQKEYPSDLVAIAWDRREPTFRHQQYEGYKANRHGMPDELASQMAPLKELLTALGYPMFSLAGFEADDLLGTMAAFSEQQGMETVIATGDRDSLQLIDEHTAVCLVKTKENLFCDVAQIQKDYGFAPPQIVDLKALMGDASDCIPGVKGIGEKTALKLLQQNGTVEQIYADLDSIDTTPRIKKLLAEGREMAALSYELATICREAPLSLSVEDLTPKEPDRAAAKAILTDLEMFSMLPKWNLEEEVSAAAPEAPAAVEKFFAEDWTEQKLCEALEENGRIDCVWQEDGVYFCLPDGVVRFAETVLDTVVLPSKLPKRLFDAKPLYKRGMQQGVRLEQVTFDASLAAYLLNVSAKAYPLPQLVQKYLPEETFGLPAEVAPIAAFSALCDALEAQLREKEMWHLLQDIELPLCEVLASMETDGFLLDRPALLAYGEELKAQIETLRQQLFDYAGHTFNPNSTRELGTVLFDELGLPAKKKTKTGYSTNAEVLESLRGFHGIVDTLLEYRKLSKLYSTYIVGLDHAIEADGRVRSTFNQTETRTGRISSTEPNVQNIPVRTDEGSRFRAFFIAPEGKVLLDADYSQIELRILAHIADDQAMQQGFAQGADIHRMTASQVFHVPFEEVTARQRSSAKAINFGIVYGIGAYSLSQDLHVSMKEAKDYIDAYLSTYSGVRAYRETIIQKTEELGYVETLFHRRRELPDIHAKNKVTRALAERIALNTPIQGTAADIIKIAMVRVFDRLRREGMNTRLILQVHDELILEAPEEEAARAADILREEMQQAVSLKVALPVDVHTGKNWLEAKG